MRVWCEGRGARVGGEGRGVRVDGLGYGDGRALKEKKGLRN